MFNKGDVVVMHTCMESAKFDGKLWVCESNEEVKNSGGLKQKVVKLNGYEYDFPTRYLQRVDVTSAIVVDVNLVAGGELNGHTII